MSKKCKELDWYLQLCEKSFADDTKLGVSVTCCLCCHSVTPQQDGKFHRENFFFLWNSKKGKCQVLHLGRNNFHAPGKTVGSLSAEKDRGELVYNQADYKPAKCSYDKADSWIPLGKADRWSRDVISALCSALVRHVWSAVSRAEAQKHWKAWNSTAMREAEKEQIVQSGEEKAFVTERGHLSGVCK